MRSLHGGGLTVRLVTGGLLLGMVAAACGDDATNRATCEQGTSTSAPTTATVTTVGRLPVAAERIAFHSDRDGNPEIYVMDADGSNVTRLTNDPADDGFPTWSPDGSRIAFFSDRDGNPEIYVMDADGSNVTRLTNHPALDAVPAWSPTP